MTEHASLMALEAKVDHVSMVAVLAALGVSDFDSIPRDGVHVYEDIVYVERFVTDYRGVRVVSRCGESRFLRATEAYSLKQREKAREVIAYLSKMGGTDDAL